MPKSIDHEGGFRAFLGFYSGGKNRASAWPKFTLTQSTPVLSFSIMVEQDPFDPFKKAELFEEKVRGAMHGKVRKLERFVNKPLLEEKFNRVETLDINGQKVKVLDIAPRKPKNEVPVVFAPGYATGSPLDYKVNILKMVQEGRRVLYIDEPHGIDYEGTIERPHTKETSEVEEFLLKQIAALMGTLDKKGIKKASVLGHSEGAMYALLAASLYPEKFQDLVLFDSAGMAGEETRRGLISRFLSEAAGNSEVVSPAHETRLETAYRYLIKTISWVLNVRKKIRIEFPNDIMTEDTKKQLQHGRSDVIDYFWENKQLAFKEIESIAKTHVIDLLRDVHDKGVGIVLVHGAEDTVFTMQKVQEQISKAAPVGESLPVDGFLSVKGGHGALTIHPDEYTKLADIMFTSLQQKREKKENKRIRIEEAIEALRVAQRKLDEELEGQ